MAGVSLKHRLEFVGYRVLVSGLSRMPVWLADVASAMLGLLGSSVLRIRRRVVDDNLLASFPEESPEWRGRIARQSYRHLVRESLNMVRLTRLGPESVAREVRLEDFDEVRDAMADGRGAIVVSGHLGNWELGGAAVAAYGVPITAVAVRQKNPLFDEYIVDSRRRLGMEIVHRYLGWKPLLAALKAGKLLALVADQSAGNAGIFVEFLGRPASTARGPAVLAHRTGAPLFMAVCVRNPDPGAAKGFRYTVRFVPVAVEGTGGDDVPALIQRCQSILGDCVRQYPSQYFWHHRRWKIRPREEPAPAE